MPPAGQADAAPPDSSWLQEIQQAFFTQRCLHAVARLGVADALAPQPLPIEVLAARVGAHPDALYRILRFLSSRDIFVESAPRIFALSPRAQSLRSDVAGSARWYLMHDLMGRASFEILHSARTGGPAFDKLFSKPVWEYLAEHSDQNEWFNRHMQSQALALAMPVVNGYDWSRSRVVVDVGGGTGLFMGALLQRHAHLSGVLVDQPHVIAAAPAVLAEAGITTRCRIVAGSFFEKVAAQGDTYVLSRILHDWNDDDALRILTALRESMPRDARLLILEMLIPEDGKPHVSKMFDVAMLLLFGGRERTRAEFERLLASAGFGLRTVSASMGPSSVLEASAA